MHRRRTALLISALATIGCASGGASGAGASPSPASPAPARRSLDVITQAELETSTQGDVFTAIQQLRPTFLQMRGRGSTGVATAPEVIQVYVNGSHMGGVDALKQIRPSEVKEIRHLSAAEATQRYGTDHTQGAILVTTK